MRMKVAVENKAISINYLSFLLLSLRILNSSKWCVCFRLDVLQCTVSTKFFKVTTRKFRDLKDRLQRIR
jgi:hypothetical protein